MDEKVLSSKDEVFTSVGHVAERDDLPVSKLQALVGVASDKLLERANELSERRTLELPSEEIQLSQPQVDSELIRRVSRQAVSSHTHTESATVPTPGERIFLGECVQDQGTSSSSTLGLGVGNGMNSGMNKPLKSVHFHSTRTE